MSSFVTNSKGVKKDHFFLNIKGILRNKSLQINMNDRFLF